MNVDHSHDTNRGGDDACAHAHANANANANASAKRVSELEVD